MEFPFCKMKKLWRWVVMTSQLHNNLNALINATELTVHLKMVKMENFIFVYFTTIKIEDYIGLCLYMCLQAYISRRMERNWLYFPGEGDWRIMNEEEDMIKRRWIQWSIMYTLKTNLSSMVWKDVQGILNRKKTDNKILIAV